MKEKKLIDKAKSFKTGNRKKMIINDEIIELSLAWANNELTMRQVAFALNKTIGINCYPILANALKEYLLKTKSI